MPYRIVVTLDDNSTQEFTYQSNDITGAAEEYQNDSNAQFAREHAKKIEFQLIS